MHTRVLGLCCAVISQVQQENTSTKLFKHCWSTSLTIVADWRLNKAVHGHNFMPLLPAACTFWVPTIVCPLCCLSSNKLVLYMQQMVLRYQISSSTLSRIFLYCKRYWYSQIPVTSQKLQVHIHFTYLVTIKQEDHTS